MNLNVIFWNKMVFRGAKKKVHVWLHLDTFCQEGGIQSGWSPITKSIIFLVGSILPNQIQSHKHLFFCPIKFNPKFNPTNTYFLSNHNKTYFFVQSNSFTELHGVLAEFRVFLENSQMCMVFWPKTGHFWKIHKIFGKLTKIFVNLTKM